MIENLPPPILPPTWSSLNGERNPEAFRAMFASHVARQRLRWFRSWPEPDFDFQSGQFPEGRAGLLREEVAGANEFWAIVATADKFSKQIGAVGQIPVGQMMILTMSDELPLSDGDVVVPLGKTITQGVPDASWRAARRVLVRGASVEPRTGTVSGASASTALTGVGTSFTLDLRVGSIIEVLGYQLVVSAIASNAALTLSAPLPQGIASAEWSRCEDVFPLWPTLRINGIRRALGTVPKTAYQISAMGDRIEWLSLVDAPDPGEKFSILWDYMPRYVVREMGGYSRATTVQGVGMPQMVFADELVGSASS